MQARLVTIEQGAVAKVFPVEAAGTVYGRAGGDLVQIEDADVSRRHFRISRRRGAWHIQDLGSKNGTFVNGQRVHSGFLQPGDEVRLGSTVLYLAVGAEADLPVTGQMIDVSTKAYQQTIPRRAQPSPGRPA